MTVCLGGGRGNRMREKNESLKGQRLEVALQQNDILKIRGEMPTGFEEWKDRRKADFIPYLITSIIWISSTMMYHFLCQSWKVFHIHYSSLVFKTSREIGIMVPILPR